MVGESQQQDRKQLATWHPQQEQCDGWMFLFHGCFSSVPSLHLYRPGSQPENHATHSGWSSHPNYCNQDSPLPRPIQRPISQLILRSVKLTINSDLHSGDHKNGKGFCSCLHLLVVGVERSFWGSWDTWKEDHLKASRATGNRGFQCIS